jgi:hypothetical protein
MTQSKRFWFLRKWEAWLVLGMSIAAAVMSKEWWTISLGVIGYLLVLLFEAGLDPRSLVRAVHAEQENRTMVAEKLRLVAGFNETQARIESLEATIRQLTQELEAAREEIKRLTRQR